MDVSQIMKTQPLMYSVLNTLFQKGIQDAPKVFTNLYESVSSGSKENVYAWLNRLPGMRLWKNNTGRVHRNVESDDFSVPNKRYEDTIDIPVDDLADEQAPVYSKAAQMMGRSCATIVDELMAKALNEGFTITESYDGVTMFSAAHVAGITSYSNLGTGQLTETNFKTAVTALGNLRLQADVESTPIPVNAGMKLLLVVPEVLRFTAVDILERQLIGGGNSNPLYKYAEILPTSYLTSNTAWFLFNMNGGIKPFFLQEREKFKMVSKTPLVNPSDRNFELDLITYAGKWRGAVCPTMPYLMYGSTGEDESSSS